MLYLSLIHIYFNFSIDSMLSQTNLIKPFFKSYINEKGADITPLKNILHALYNEEKAFNNKIDYGVVAVKYPKLTPIEITKEEMKPVPALSLIHIYVYKRQLIH